jgi:MOSC domain-containing protein YiiM
VNANDGGVPKRPIPGAEVTTAGLVADRQADRKHHGRPFQALCLWSTDVIGELASAGHPIEAGSAGENLTLSGVDWAALRPGTRLRIGEVLAELSFPATPCKKQTRWFNDGDFGRIDHERNPRWTRWYAWVREPGKVAPGDEVLVQPS